LHVRIYFVEIKTTISTTEAQINDIFNRGVGTFIDPSDNFRKKLVAKINGTSNEEIIIKFGVDPTRPDIHLGHAVVLRKLRQLQDMGCKVIFLIGDFTAQIGDPTGKNKARPEVEQATIEGNMKTYLDQVGKILNLDKSVFSWIRNSDWFYGVTDITASPDAKVELNIKNSDGMEQTVSIDPNSFVGKAVLFDQTRMQTSVLKKNAHGVTFATILSILRQVTLGQLVERDMFQDRIKSGEPLFMHEMMYPVMQGIDSIILARIYGSCDLEVGGTDQTFNMLMGRKVMEIGGLPQQSVLAFSLLVGTDGKEKMSKSLDNYISIIDQANDIFGKVMSIPDSAIPSYLALCTFSPMEEVDAIVAGVQSGKLHPKEIKMNLAEQITAIYHGQEKAKNAREAFVNAFQKKEIPDDVPVVKVKKGTLLVDALLFEKLVESKTDFRRLLDAGAIRKDGEEKLTDPHTALTETVILKIGKHRFVSFQVL
jgi:tyrosyl-tRNA synthetase